MDKKIWLRFKATPTMGAYWKGNYHFFDGKLLEVHYIDAQNFLKRFPKNFFIDVAPEPPPELLPKSLPKSLPKKFKKVVVEESIVRIPNYRFIEDLHNIHKGEEIWILGCGPSLDDFPDNFFYEKYRIAIAASWSMVGYPNCTYTAFSQREKEQMAHVLKYRKHLLYKHIVRLRPIELKNKIFFSPEPIYLCLNEKIELGLPDPIYLQIRGMKLGDYKIGSGELDKRRAYWSSLAKNLINGTSVSYTAAGTCIHTDIQAAIIMGAKKVTLAGCEGKCLKFQAHAYKHGMDKIYKRYDRIPKDGLSDAHIAGERISQKRMRAGVAFLAKIMKPHGVQIARYYYGKGYEEISLGNQ